MRKLPCFFLILLRLALNAFAQDFKKTSQAVKKGGKLKINLANDGGWVAMLKSATKK